MTASAGSEAQCSLYRGGQDPRAVLREDPDVILVGELRDLETIRLALTAAETGHLFLVRCTPPRRQRLSTG